MAHHGRAGFLVAAVIGALVPATAATAAPKPAASAITAAPDGFAAEITTPSFSTTVSGSGFKNGSVQLLQCESYRFSMTNGYIATSPTSYTTTCALLTTVTVSGNRFPATSLTVTDTFTSMTGAAMNCRQPAGAVGEIPGACGIFARHTTRSAELYFAPISFEGPYRCGGRAATMYGTYYDDSITGTEAADVIVDVMGDNNVVYGGGGDDWVCTGPGVDHIMGGVGSDVISSGSGNDFVSGGIAGGANNDDYTLCLAGWDNGIDTLLGGSGNDVVNGCSNNDLVYGNSGNDTLYGNDGDDVMRGGTGSDVLYGENGDDSLYGETGSDLVDGGAHTIGDSCDGGLDVDLDSLIACELLTNVL